MNKKSVSHYSDNVDVVGYLKLKTFTTGGGDKKKAIELLLNDSEWSLWSDTAIAKKCSVDHKSVSKYRLSLGNSQVSENKERTYTTKHGTQAVMNTEKIGSKVNLEFDVIGKYVSRLNELRK